MFYPIFASTLTTVLAFLPLAFWPDFFGVWIRVIPRTVLVVLLCSFFVTMIIIRNIGDEIYLSNPNWIDSIEIIKLFSKIFLTMAMAAIGLSTNLKDIKDMGYKPFIVGFIAMLTVGIVCILTIESYLRFFI